ncbi:prenyltransferase/squalene oxidase repeat-containing protein [Micromonospora sp. WMMD1082]|uniref:prenyltransferase/squalene oxidase repeat-containing protein n=1 Tax=Micromonospora sp. WMMD1082 TaxID=3016104 RepID=UPI0024176D27|nr:prenyltransferase/squalene oxidase repeat-containing protein [Micromonospora sp. WMMD1082]MDG4794527.1 prenyltransferase/squalene oxidase repeat-containing protein [Micromonospora sp. WMMD1082]
MTTVDGQAPAGATADVRSQVRDLVAEMMREPAGRTSPSPYETARLVSLAPWLVGHHDRVRYLLDTQRPDGAWGQAGGYALVPTLSATEALLAVLRSDPPVDVAGPARAVDRGLAALFRLVRDAAPLPDMPAVDLIVPALVDGINHQLHRLTARPPAGLRRWQSSAPLALPPGITRDRLTAVRRLVAAGGPIPDKLLHALEVVADVAPAARGVTPTASGSVGASPAATAAWLGKPDRPDGGGALAYLESTVGRHGGPVPCAAPITVFERAWVTTTLARAGIALTDHAGLISSLTANLGATGTPTGPGLPADADTTSVTLVALGHLGAPVPPDCLWSYETPEGFCTWPGEDGFSSTTNAHVLDAFGQHLAAPGRVQPRHHATVRRLVTALRERQDPQGSWSDRWHASGYYATACCAQALAEFGSPAAVAEPLTRAVGWTLATQREDGAWGTWAATAEETAYALQILLAGGAHRPAAVEAIRRGYAYLRQHDGPEGPALWHDKDLYQPTRIVRAAVLAAQHQAGSLLAAPSGRA